MPTERGTERKGPTYSLQGIIVEAAKLFNSPNGDFTEYPLDRIPTDSDLEALRREINNVAPEGKEIQVSAEGAYVIRLTLVTSPSFPVRRRMHLTADYS